MTLRFHFFFPFPSPSFCVSLFLCFSVSLSLFIFFLAGVRAEGYGRAGGLAPLRPTARGLSKLPAEPAEARYNNKSQLGRLKRRRAGYQYD